MRYGVRNSVARKSRAHLWDFLALKMEFQKEGKRVLIYGMGVEKSEVNCNSTFLQELRRVEEGLILQIWELGSVQNEVPKRLRICC